MLVSTFNFFLCIFRRKRTLPSTPETTPKKPRASSFHRSTSDAPSSVNVSPQCSPSVLPNNDDTDDTDDTDDDIVILETVSTPKPKKLKIDLTKVKTERKESDADVSMLLECSDDAAVDAHLEADAAGGSSGSPAVGTSPMPAGLASATTQTENPKVKQEGDNEKQSEKKEVQSTSSKDDHSDNTEKCLDIDATAGPSCPEIKSPTHHPSLTDVQEQQDLLLELMQTTAQERDSFKEQVTKLTCQLKDTQSRLQEMSQSRVKKECSHQSSETEDRVATEGAENYKSLFEKAKQKVDELIQDKEALLSAAETKPSTDPADDKDIDEIALQVDCLLRELDKKNKENEELRSQVSVSVAF